MENIKSQIDNLLYEEADDFEIAKVLKQDIKTYFETLEESFYSTSGRDFLLKHTKKIDTLIQMVYKIAMHSMFGTTYVPSKHALPITLVALGSYGREQLCVRSDIDLMIVYRDISGYNTKEMMEKILYILWDSGVKLGHRVHEVSELFEISKTDITIKTSMIESRFVEGSRYLWTEVENELQKIRAYAQESFIEAKIEEMRLMHRRFPMTMEPNLKEGVGGFRNANLVYWIGNILHHVKRIRDLPQDIIPDIEYKEFHMALEFILRVRSALHLSTGKKEDRLRLQLIPQIAKYLGYKQSHEAHMKFAKKVSSNLKIVELYSTIWIETLTSNSKATLKPQDTDSYDVLLQQLCDAGEKKFTVHPSFLQRLHTIPKSDEISSESYAIVRNIFFQPQTHDILQTLMDALILGYAIPPLNSVINLPQFDGYHQYPVGIHSLKALYYLENIEDTTLQAIYNTLNPKERALLKLVTLLHDAGKGRKQEHAILGARLFKAFAQKLLFSKEHIDIGSRLVLHHNLMSNVAQREDLHIEQTIHKFATHFPNRLELDLIYLLTYADMNGVGDSRVYNNFNEKLIRTLYHQSCIAISHGEKLYQTSKRLKKEKILKKDSLFVAQPKSFQKKILSIPSNLLFMKYSPKKIIDISLKARDLDDYSFEIKNSEFLSIEIIRKNNLDLSYLLHKLSRFDTVNMDICKLFSNIKYFKIDFNEIADEGEILLIEEIINQSLQEVHPIKLNRPNIKPKEITINCDHSQEHATMKLTCRDQKGLLSYLISVFDKLHIDISSAKIHTKMNKVTDLFLIEKNGNFCHNTKLIVQELTE